MCVELRWFSQRFVSHNQVQTEVFLGDSHLYGAPVFSERAGMLSAPAVN